MSTDDLTARVRDHLAHADTLPHGLAITLVSELADEVDRLRESALDSRLNIEGLEVELHEAKAERDAARAALERVRGVIEDGDRLDGLWIYAPDLDRALEGEPS